MRVKLAMLMLASATSDATPLSAPPARPSISSAASSYFGPADSTLFNGGYVAARNGKVLALTATGYANFSTKQPLQADSAFQLASAAKPFTSVAVLQLRDRGKLRLDDPVSRHLPGFPYPAITVRHLLSHTSGLPDLELFEPLIAREPARVVSGADLVPALAAWDKPLRFPAGDQFRYSNVNYQLLAQIVETVSGQKFGDYVRDHIFRPAGMRSSFVLGTPSLDPHREPVRNHVLAVMYQAEPEDVRTLAYPDARMMRPYRYEGYNLGSTVGDQNLFSTLADLVRFDTALRSGKILSHASQAEAYAPVKLNDGTTYSEEGIYDLYAARCSYGMGWEVCTHPVRGRLVGHAGNNRGIATIFYRELDSGLAAAMFDNADTDDFPKKFAGLVDVVHGRTPPAIDRRHSINREYGRTLVSEGPIAALIRYNRLRSDTEHWGGSGAGLNRLGYDLLHNGKAKLALEPFRLNVILNPEEANFWDSYAEALAANDQKADAILAYRRSLELKPDNPKGRKALETLEAR